MHNVRKQGTTSLKLLDELRKVGHLLRQTTKHFGPHSGHILDVTVHFLDSRNPITNPAGDIIGSKSEKYFLNRRWAKTIKRRLEQEKSVGETTNLAPQFTHAVVHSRSAL